MAAHAVFIRGRRVDLRQRVPGGRFDPDLQHCADQYDRGQPPVPQEILDWSAHEGGHAELVEYRLTALGC